MGGILVFLFVVGEEDDVLLIAAKNRSGLLVVGPVGELSLRKVSPASCGVTLLLILIVVLVVVWLHLLEWQI